jgi:hypothetical protein
VAEGVTRRCPAPDHEYDSDPGPEVVMVYHTECLPRDAEHLFSDLSWAEGYLAVRPLEWAGEYLAVIPMIYTFRVAVCTPFEVEEFWCYEDPGLALIAFGLYPNLPEGWTRHHMRGGHIEYPVKA